MSENQPTGTVTFLFTDVEGSTRRWDEQPETMKLALARHDELLREAITAHGGAIFTTAGDAFCAAFSSPKDALESAIRAQQSLQAGDWGDIGQVAVRMSLHTGNADERDGDYFGPPLNRCARLLGTAHGGQIVVSLATERLLHHSLDAGVTLQDLGAHVLKDLARPENIYQVLHPGLPSDFPPLRSVEVGTREARLIEGRRAHQENQWQVAYEELRELDTEETLDAEDLARLGDAAQWLGLIGESIKFHERAFAEYVDAGKPEPAAKLAAIFARLYLYRGAVAVCRAWAKRAEGLVADATGSEAYGYVIRMNTVLAIDVDGDLERALELAEATLRQGIATGSRNLQALGLQDKGRVLVLMGEIDQGMALIDEAMVAAVGGELDATTTGISYCNMLSACEQISDYQRAGEWSDAASAWCEQYSDSAYPGICRIYRAELMWLRGKWDQAAVETLKAAEDLSELSVIAAAAWYQLGEIQLRSGEYAEAEEAFKRAHATGKQPLPGLAMLRALQGDPAAAEALLREKLDREHDGALDRARLLPTWIDVELALDKPDKAKVAAAELEATAANCGSVALLAAAAQSRGAIDLFEGRPSEARQHLVAAVAQWRRVKLPYEAAECQIQIGETYQAEGNTHAASLEFQAARLTLTELGATGEVERVDALLAAD